MFDITDPQTFWLNVVNIALGIVTLVCLAVVVKAVISELSLRSKERSTASAGADDHAFSVQGLGLTMADGGERTDKAEKK